MTPDWVGQSRRVPDTELEKWLAKQVRLRMHEHQLTFAELGRQTGYERKTVADCINLTRRGSMMLWTCLLQAVGFPL